MPITQDRVKKLIDAASAYKEQARMRLLIAEQCAGGHISPMEAYSLSQVEGVSMVHLEVLTQEIAHYGATAARNRAEAARLHRRRNGLPPGTPLHNGGAALAKRDTEKMTAKAGLPQTPQGAGVDSTLSMTDIGRLLDAGIDPTAPSQGTYDEALAKALAASAEGEEDQGGLNEIF